MAMLGREDRGRAGVGFLEEEAPGWAWNLAQLLEGSGCLSPCRSVWPEPGSVMMGPGCPAEVCKFLRSEVNDLGFCAPRNWIRF